MADANRMDNSARLKRNVSKMAFRSREKVLRTFGRADETKDEIIDNYVHLVGKQQNQIQKFQRDLKTYISSINVMRNAAKAFYVSLDEVYENDWIGKDIIQQLARTTDLLYNDLFARLNTEVISTLQDHLNACNDMKVKVGKRGRKLVDFDATRRNYVTLQASKKLEESKLTKARDNVSNAHETYEKMNNSLHDELPELYDSRVVLCADVVHIIAVAEKDFYMELSEIRTKLMNVLASVKDAYEGGDYRIQRLHSPLSDPVARKDKVEQATLPADEVAVRSRGHSSTSDRKSSGSSRHRHNDSPGSHHSNKERDVIQQTSIHVSDSKSQSHQYVNLEIGGKITSDIEEEQDHMTNGQEENEYSTVPGDEERESEFRKPEGQKPTPSPRMSFKNNQSGGSTTPQPRPRTLLVEGQTESQERPRVKSPEGQQGHLKSESEVKGQEKTAVKRRNKKEGRPEDIAEEKKEMQPLYEETIKEITPNNVPPANTNHENGDTERDTEIFPTHYLYTAKAMYPYKGADEDELSFNKHDIIYVVEFPDPDEQDDGWQMGILKSSWIDSQSSAVEGVFPQNFTVKISE